MGEGGRWEVEAFVPSQKKSSVPGAQLHFDFLEWIGWKRNGKVSFCDFVRKAFRFNEIFQERKDKRTEGDTRGAGQFGQSVAGWRRAGGVGMKIARRHSRQNIPDRPDSRLISHPFFNVTPGLRTLEDYTQLCQQQDDSGTARTWTGTQCTQKKRKK